MEMTDSCNQEGETNKDLSASDDDSVSLLHDLNICQIRGAAEEVKVNKSDSQVGNKKRKKKGKRNQHSQAEGAMTSSVQSESTSLSVFFKAKISKCVEIPNKSRLHKRNGKGETLLHRACQKGDLVTVRALTEAGISINMEDHAGWTALHEASAAGDEAVVEELLKAGASVNARSIDGVTPLHDAVASGHYQVVKLLLQHGANASDKTLGDLSALDLAQEEGVKDLLLTSSVIHEQPRETPAQIRQAGAPSSEAPSHTQPSCQSNVSPSCGYKASAQSRESGDRGGARQLGDIQLRKNDTAADNLRPSETITAVLEEVGRKQKEMLTWPLTDLQNAGTYHGTLTQIHTVLTDVLARQRLDRDNLAQRYRSVKDYLQQRLVKSQLVSLASRQRNLVEILQKQMYLVDVYVSTKAKLSSQPPNHQGSAVVRRQPDNVSTAASSKPRSATSNAAEELTVLRPTAPLLTAGKKTPARSRARHKKAGNTFQHVNFRRKGKNALIQTQPEDKTTHLSILIQRGVMPPGSSLRLLLKGQQHLAHVLRDGLINDSKGKRHLAPECWLESILGNNIPVSSAYAWDKVIFRDKPLSYYLKSTEAEGNIPQTHSEDHAQHCRAASSQKTPEAVSLNCLMKVKIIHLVDDEELWPNAVMDFYWEKLLKKDYSEFEDWGSELL